MFRTLFTVLLSLLLCLGGCSRGPRPPEHSASSSPAISAPAPSSKEGSSSSGSQSGAKSGTSASSSAPAKEESLAEVPQSSGTAGSGASPPSSGSPHSSEGSSGSKPGAGSHPTPPPPPASDSSESQDVPLGIDGGRYLTITEAEIMALVNQERKALGLTPLTQDPQLALAARLRAAEMFQNDYLDHTRPDGSPWETILKTEVPTAYAQAAENLAYQNHLPGHNIPAYQWFTLWKESPDHYAAMVNPQYTHFGVGVLTGPYHKGEDQTYAVNLFCSY